MRVTIAKPTSYNGPAFHVHSTDCRDLKVRGKYLLSESFVLTADTLAQIAETVYPKNCFDWEEDEGASYLGDFEVFPCATGIER